MGNFNFSTRFEPKQHITGSDYYKSGLFHIMDFDKAWKLE